MKNASKTLGALAVLGFAVFVGLTREARTTSPAIASGMRETSVPSRAVAHVAPVVVPPAPKGPRAASGVPTPIKPTELELMRSMRELIVSDPEQALSLARAAQVRFGETEDSAQRDWVIVKSLTTLGRFHDAQNEAGLLVARFPDSPWASDVERHMLLYPLDQPSREEQQASVSDLPDLP